MIHLPFLPGKQRLVILACNQKRCTPPTTTAFAVMMRSGYNNGGLLGVLRCSVVVMNSLILLEYTDCFLWYLMFVSNVGMCYICTVSYRIVLRAYRDMYRSLCIGDIPVCQCIVSALVCDEIGYPFPNFNGSTIAPPKFGNGWLIYSTLYQVCNCLSMLGIKLIYISVPFRSYNLYILASTTEFVSGTVIRHASNKFKGYLKSQFEQD